jgi:uncharacterized membrane protein YGL010W
MKTNKNLKNFKIMKQNVGSTDKLVRLALAIVLIVLYYKEVLTGTLGYVALGLALVLTITSLISFCPLYVPFGLKTTKKTEEEKK